MKWERVTIFISSTFNDMHAERDYLVKDVFPELREWCESRKIHLVDVDLRWGVTEEDSNSNHTVLACLNNIDNSRPFFLCFLGQRRGWVPTEVSPETLEEYPGVSAILGHNSVTEMEIEHALLAPMRHIVGNNERLEQPVEHALFYFRSPDYLSGLTESQRKIFTNDNEKDKELAEKELAKFKDKIWNNWTYTTDYDCQWDKTIISPELLKVRDSNNNIIDRTDGAEQGRLADFTQNGTFLKDIIIQQLKEEIQKEFPDRQEEFVYASDLERDLDQQALFIELNSEGFISREGDFDDINDYLLSDKDGLFILTAPAGYGKSMLLANFILKESRKYNARFFNRFCGVSDLCSQQYSLWKTIFDEAKITCPDTLKDLQDKIEDLLKELAKEKTVIVIDAINQLPDGLTMLEWLPKQLPENFKIILSLKEDDKDEKSVDIIEKLKNNEQISYSNVKPFDNKEEKKKLIRDYLKKYLKSLDENQIDTICDSKGSKNPLFLKILLSELRIFGSYDQLSDEIKKFGATPKEAFNTVLSRLEKDINSLNINSEKFTSLLFGLLANARTGLSEEEMKSCIQKELPHIEDEKLIPAINLFIRQVRPFMARREGRTDYFYEAFKLAAEQRYISNKVHYNKILAGYFKQQADPIGDFSFTGKNIRDFNELPYHLKESENTVLLEEILSSYRWIKNKTELSDIYNTINDFDDIDNETDDNYHVKLIKDTLIMSSHILKDNCKELPTQLWGRLKEIENSKIKELLTEIDRYTDYPWLKPRHYMNSPEGALKLTLTGHTDSVYSVCFSSDGRFIASGSRDNTIRVWDVETKKEIIKFEGHTGDVNSVCFSSDDRFIASGSDDKTIRVWNVETKKEIIKFEGHIENVNSVCFSSDGRYIASGSGCDVYGEEYDENTIRVWDIETQKVIKQFEHTRWVQCVCFSSNGRYIVSSESMDESVRVWDVETQKVIKQFEHTSWVQCVCVSSDNRFIASGLSDNTIRVWDVETQKEIIKFEGHIDYVQSMRFSNDGRFIVSGSYDKTIRVWDVETQKEIKKFEGHTGSVCFSSDDRYIVSGSYDKTIRVWDMETQKEIKKIEGHTGYVNSVCFSSDDRFIAFGAADNTVRIWDVETQKVIKIFKGHTDNVNSVCFSIDNRLIVSGSDDKTIRIWDVETKKGKNIFKGHELWVSSVLFSADSRFITSVSGDHTIRVWDVETQKEIKKFEGHTDFVMCMCVSNDDRFIAAGLDAGTVCIWDVKTQKQIKKFEGHTIEDVACVCFSNDGRFIASGLTDNTIRVWDVETQKEIKKIEGHTRRVNSVYFSSDNRYIVSGSADGTICVWDTKKRKKSQSIIIKLNAEKEVDSCTFSNKNHQVLAIGSSRIFSKVPTGQILIYDIKNLPMEM